MSLSLFMRTKDALPRRTSITTFCGDALSDSHQILSLSVKLSGRSSRLAEGWLPEGVKP